MIGLGELKLIFETLRGIEIHAGGKALKRMNSLLRYKAPIGRGPSPIMVKLVAVLLVILGKLVLYLRSCIEEIVLLAPMYVMFSTNQDNSWKKCPNSEHKFTLDAKAWRDLLLKSFNEGSTNWSRQLKCLCLVAWLLLRISHARMYNMGL